MPELPEVEFARRLLERNLARTVVKDVVVHDARVVSGGAAPFARALRGAAVIAVARRGKRLRIDLADGTFLLSHLGMTGKWLVLPDDAPTARFEKVRLVVEVRGGRGAGGARAAGGAGRAHGPRRAIVYADPRILGRLRVTDDEKLAFRGLGPDPLEDGIDVRALAAALAPIRRSIKETLLDQRLISGVGNIHAQEALFRARIDPRRRASDLDLAEVKRLARGIRATFDHALREVKGAKTITYVEEAGAENPFLIYGRGGSPCPRCKTKLTRIVQGGRSTVFCAKCQKAPA